MTARRLQLLELLLLLANHLKKTVLHGGVGQLKFKLNHSKTLGRLNVPLELPAPVPTPGVSLLDLAHDCGEDLRSK